MTSCKVRCRDQSPHGIKADETGKDRQTIFAPFSLSVPDEKESRDVSSGCTRVGHDNRSRGCSAVYSWFIGAKIGVTSLVDAFAYTPEESRRATKARRGSGVVAPLDAYEGIGAKHPRDGTSPTADVPRRDRSPPA